MLLIQRMVSSLPPYSYPINPKAKGKKEKKKLNYFFVSTKIVEIKDSNGVVYERIQTSSYKREFPKEMSKRDIHRNK